ncbi:MAG: hypothetical protein HYT98_01655 [Candidatus Sungbacteria bacterium]|nr:hypothetical protein [Candidatus Sungbacteria bacterium]
MEGLRKFEGAGLIRRDGKTEFNVEKAAEWAAERAEEWYTQIDPKIGTYLVDANVVLTVAGARGQTELFIDNAEEKDLETIKKLNALSEPQGVRFNVREFSEKLHNGGKFIGVEVESLKGYEFTSRRSKIPGITPFDSSKGWDAVPQWRISLEENMKRLQQEGVIPRHLKVDSLNVGFEKGYPDRAIYDFAEEKSHKEKHGKELTDAAIPLVGLYGGAIPIYNFYAEHRNDPEIMRHQLEWETTLNKFYQSNWHQKLKEDPIFKQWRSQHK